MTHYCFKNSMKLKDMVKVKLSYCHSSKRMEQWKKMGILA